MTSPPLKASRLTVVAMCSGTADDLKRYKDIQKEQQNECRKANQAYVRDMVTENPKKLYSFIKGKRSDNFLT